MRRRADAVRAEIPAWALRRGVDFDLVKDWGAEHGWRPLELVMARYRHHLSRLGGGHWEDE